MSEKRITVFMGHYGSGKTFIAVNYALMLARSGKDVSIYDLDIVNPYFRTVDAERELKKRGINVTLRQEQGHDIDAACGQLRSKRMNNTNN